jgi:hypothetical protein
VPDLLLLLLLLPLLCRSYRGVGSNDVCQYKLVDGATKGRRVWEDRWSKKRCQCDA